MVVIVRGTVPAGEFALGHVFESVPALEFEIERVIDSNNRSVMPLLWVRGAEQAALEEAFEEDPSVTNAELLDEFEEELLYRLEWDEGIELKVRMITNSAATIMDAYGSGGRWRFRVMYPDRDTLSEMHDFCSDHGLSFNVESIRELEGESAGRYGMTNRQYEALTAAAERGLFEVPRGVTVSELASDLNISHQALSERIRRGTGALVEERFPVEAPE